VRQYDLRFAVISWDDLASGLVPVHSLLDPVMQPGFEFVVGGSFAIFLFPPMVGLIEGLASVATRCCMLVVGLFDHALRAYRDRLRFRITEIGLFTLTSTAMTFITEACLKLPEPDQSTLSLLLRRQAYVLAALIAALIRSATDTEYGPLIRTLLLADADGAVDLEVDSDQEEQIEEIE
jgi:hypothetical protein